MKNANRLTSVLVGCVVLLGGTCLCAQDWPQWRGPNRSATATGFKAPKTWPKELTKKWRVTVGSGVATPALVGDRLYVATREDGNEIIRCLKASNGEEVWQDKYSAAAPTRPGSGFNNEFVGPRASPAVGEGKVVTLGVRGTLSCYDAAKGKRLWRHNEIKGWPRFFTSSSPIIVDKLCVAQLGSPDDGAVVAYELAGGKEKWKWTGDGPAYASLALLTVGDTKAIIAETNTKIVALSVDGGKLLWETAYRVGGRRGYNASTPLVDGQTVIYAGSGRGTKAVRLEKKGDKLVSKELWSNTNGVMFNTPVLTNGLLFGLSENDRLFCINAKDGKTAWTASLGGGGGRRGGGYGSIVAAGSVLLALTPTGQLTVFEANAKEFKKLASYTVGTQTYAYPVVSGNRILVKDQNALTLWTVE